MSGQIPAGDVAGGEGKREGEHEGTSGYLVVVLEGVKVVGGGLPAEDRTGGRRRTAAGCFRWAEVGEDWLGRFCRARGSSRCGQFGEERNGGGSSTATRASRRRQWRSGGSVRAQDALGGPFIAERGGGGSLAP
jgi:hypothetical protein